VSLDTFEEISSDFFEFLDDGESFFGEERVAFEEVEKVVQEVFGFGVGELGEEVGVGVEGEVGLLEDFEGGFFGDDGFEDDAVRGGDEDLNEGLGLIEGVVIFGDVLGCDFEELIVNGEVFVGLEEFYEVGYVVFGVGFVKDD
jgi:hypothetical protein